MKLRTLKDLIKPVQENYKETSNSKNEGDSLGPREVSARLKQRAPPPSDGVWSPDTESSKRPDSISCDSSAPTTSIKSSGPLVRRLAAIKDCSKE